MIGIYKITSPSGRVYIGQSNNLERRQNDYSKYLKSSCRQVKLLNSINKYGWDNHSFAILEECQLEELNVRERYWQEYYDCVDNGLNCIYTKTNIKPSLFSKESRENMKNAHLGKTASLITRKKMSDKRKDFIVSKSTKDKISKAHLGKPKKFSVEGKKSLSIATTLRQNKAISCLSPEGKYFEFESFKQAGQKIGVSYQSVQLALKKNRSCKDWTNFKLIKEK